MTIPTVSPNQLPQMEAFDALVGHLGTQLGRVTTATLASQIGGTGGGGGAASVIATSNIGTLAGTLPTATDYRVIDRDAFFEWNPANLSAAVSGDPQKVIYVPPTSTPSGASGAYVLRFADKKVTAENCGIFASPTVDQFARMSEVIQYINSGEIEEFTFGAGTYQFSNTLPSITASDWVIKGLNRGATLLRLDAGTGTHRGRLFYLNGNGGVIRRAVLRDFRIDCQSGDDQNAQFFKVDGVTLGTIENIGVGVGVAGIIAAGIGGGANVSQLDLRQIQGGYRGGSVVPWDFGSCQVTTVDRCQVTSTNASTVPIIRIAPGAGETADTFRLFDSALYAEGCPQNCLIDITNGSMTNFWMNNSTMDRASTNNILIRDTGSTGTRWCRNIWLTNNFLTLLRQDEGGTAGPAIAISQAGGTDSRINDIHLIGNLITYDDGAAVRVTRTGLGQVTGLKAIGNAVKQMATSAGQAPTQAVFDMAVGDFVIQGNTIGPRFHTSFLRTNYLVRTTADVSGFKVIGNNDDGVLLGTMQHFAYAAPSDTRVVLGNSSLVGSMAAVSALGVSSLAIRQDNVTISGAGAVSASGRSYIRLTSNSGVADDLTDLTDGVDGQIMVLYAESGHTITVKQAVGKFRLAGGTDKVLTSFLDRLVVQYSTGANSWLQIAYSDNA